jgi:hypothetical protein
MASFAVWDVSTVGCVTLSATSFFLPEQDRSTAESSRRNNIAMDTWHIFLTGFLMATTWLALFF